MGDKFPNLGIDFYLSQRYNVSNKKRAKKKLIYYNTFHDRVSRGEREKRMGESSNECEVLRTIITEEVEKCKDADLLDLIYKMLVIST